MIKDKIKIFVAEDSLTQSAEINYILTSEGFEVKCFDSGCKLLEFISQNDISLPHVIISDIVMPEMNGYELCKAIKKKFKEIPIILLTSLSDPSDVINGLVAGADNFITKPYKPDFLISRINFMLINRELRRSRSSEIGINIQFGGKDYLINSEKAQILDLLFSSFENAVQKNTELNIAIQTLKQREIELEAAKATAELAVKTKTQFLATMSHEIRTPMNGILGMYELLADTPLTRDQLEYLNGIKVSATNLLTIINDILDYSKLESKLFTLEKKEFSLTKCVEDSLLTASSNVKQIQTDRLEILSFIHPDTPDAVIGDPVRVRQILLNLLNNAIKFTPEGHVLLYIRPDYDFCRDFQYANFNTPSLKEQVKNNQIKIKILIADTGVGIKKEDLGKLFQSFTQIDNTASRRHEGTGLGLSICKQLVNLMDGKIQVESQYEKGSTFSFSIALGIKNPQSLDKKTASKDMLKEKTALIFDDNSSSLSILESYCSEFGLLINSTNNIDTVETLYKKNNFDYIFADTTVDKAHLERLLSILKNCSFHDTEKNCILIGNYIDKKNIISSVLGSSPENLKWLFLPKPILKSSFIELLKSCASANHDKNKDSTSVPQPIEKVSSIKLKDLKILLAEDNLINQKVALNILKKSGFENVDIAEDGLVVLDKLKNEFYDLIFMDMQMPNMDGLTTTKEIRKTLPPSAQPTIIAMTANAMAEDETACIRAGMNDFLAKPISSEKVIQLIKKHIAL